MPVKSNMQRGSILVNWSVSRIKSALFTVSSKVPLIASNGFLAGSLLSSLAVALVTAYDASSFLSGMKLTFKFISPFLMPFLLKMGKPLVPVCPV
jgi:hypothetical protein